jgi:hypothetical protein
MAVIGRILTSLKVTSEQSNELTEHLIPRAFHSSNDPAPPYYTVWQDDDYRRQILFRCRCGLQFEIFPDPSGVHEWKHWCGFHRKLVLEDYHRLFEKKKK